MVFFQRSFADLLSNYAYALTEWSLSGGDDRLSAADAKNKATSATEEIITFAKQVKYVPE